MTNQKVKFSYFFSQNQPKISKPLIMLLYTFSRDPRPATCNKADVVEILFLTYHIMLVIVIVR